MKTFYKKLFHREFFSSFLTTFVIPKSLNLGNNKPFNKINLKA